MRGFKSALTWGGCVACRESVVGFVCLFVFFLICIDIVWELLEKSGMLRKDQELARTSLFICFDSEAPSTKWKQTLKFHGPMNVSLSSRRTELRMFTLLKKKRQQITCSFDCSCCWTVSCVLDHFSLHSQWWSMNIAWEIFSMNHSQRADSTRLTQVWLPPSHTAEFTHPNAPPVFLPFHRAHYRHYNFRL